MTSSAIQKHSKYNHRETEAKWVKQWESNQIYKTPELKTGDKKKYILDAFAYPSGTGLHAGHAEGYTASDISARYARLNGWQVLTPIGWDSFGLPSENFANKTGKSPKLNTEVTISYYQEQVKQLGIQVDWSREIATHNPSYYKWTQWLFQLLYKRGLAYKKEALVNWDPIDKTVLANEQVTKDGTAERSGAIVEQKLMSQWFFKITDYAERLLTDLDGLDWPESTKQMQRNWIGKSDGAEVEFGINYEGQSDLSIKIFTTAHDTIYGVTFLVISPEHALVAQLTTEDNKTAMVDYVTKAKQKSQLERTDLNKDKSGVFTGSYATHPLTGGQIPVWVADYVLTSYGTGAVMAVPGEDERDYEFANKYDLPIIYTNHTNSFVSYSKEIKPNKDKYTLINSNEFDGLTYAVAREKILDKLIQNNQGKAVTNYRLRDWSIGRQRYWGCPIPVYYNDGQEYLIPENDLPLILPEDIDMTSGKIKPLGENLDFVNSASKLYGEGAVYEGDTMDTFVCSSWYFLRFISQLPENVLAEPKDLDNWFPIDEYLIGAEHSTMHLLYARFFTKVMFDAGYLKSEEPFIKMRHPGLILGQDGQKMSKSKGNVVNPIDIVEQYGADTLRMYEMFMGPFDQPKPWNTDSIKGVRRLIERIWAMQDRVYYSSAADSSRLSQSGIIQGPKTERTIEKELQKLTKKIGEDIESYSFNTCISEFMKFVNMAEEVGALTNNQFLRFLILLHPFAPFVTEEIYSQFELPNKKPSISMEQWPGFEAQMLVDTTVKYMVQVNGKVRGEFEIETSMPEAAVIAVAKESVSKWLNGQEIKFCKVVTGKLVSLVVG